MLQKKNIPLLNKDLWFSVLCAAVIAFASYELYREMTSRISYTGTNRVGTITFKRNTAQRKYADVAIWELLDRRNPVYNLDTIRTSPDSDARLILDGNVDIALAEQTLIVVNTTPRGFDIEFTGGSLSTLAASRLTIRYKNTSIVVEEGTDFTLKEVEDGLLHLTVNEGRASVDNRQNVTVVESNKSAMISDSKVTISELYFKKRYPRDSSVLVTGKDTMMVAFSWESASQNTRVIVSDLRDFSRILFDGDKSQAAVDLAAGRYFWKLAADSVESEIYSFHVNKEPVPRILTPADNAVLKTPGGDIHFETSWLNSGNADSYTLLVYPKGSANAIKEISTLNNSTAISGIEAGTYELRVRPNFSYATDTADLLSAPVTIHVESVSAMNAPEITFPAEGMQFSDTIAEAEGISVYWKGSPGATHYEAGLFTDKSLSKPFHSATVTGNSYRFSTAPARGECYITVTAYLGSTKGQSATRRISIGGTSGPSLISPQTDASFETESIIAFAWNDDQKAFSYKLEITKDESFNEIVKSADTAYTSKSFALSEPGVYFARVCIYGKDKAVLVKGTARRFVVAGIIDGPSFLDIYRYADVNLTVADKLASGWTTVEKATKYKIELAQMAQGMREVILYSNETSNTYAEVPGFKQYEPGRYFFRLKAYEIKDGLLMGSSKPVIHYFELKKTQQIQFITPSVIFIRVN